MTSIGSFVPGEKIPPLTNMLKKCVNNLSPFPIGDPQITQFALGLFTCFLSRSWAAYSGLYPSQAWGHLKL